MPDQLSQLLDQIDRLDQEATKGPWGHQEDNVMGDPYVENGYTKIPYIAQVVRNENDAPFIALSREAMPKLAEAVYHVLDLLDVVEKSSKYAYEFGGSKSPSLVTTNEVRKAITDAMEADDA